MSEETPKDPEVEETPETEAVASDELEPTAADEAVADAAAEGEEDDVLTDEPEAEADDEPEAEAEPEPEPAESGNGAAAEPPIPRATPRPQPRPEPAAAPLRATPAASRTAPVPSRRPAGPARRASGDSSNAGRITAITIGGIVVVALLAFGATRIFGGDEPKPAPNVAQEPSSSADAGTGNGGGGGTSATDARPDTVVAVLNGTPTQGLAKGAGDKLIAEGYSDATGMIRTGNNTADQQLPESSVLYAPGKRRQARDVASILDISARPKAVDEGTLAVANGVGGGGDSADVVVVLGLDQSP